MARTRIRQPMLSPEALELLSVRFRVLGDPTRHLIHNTQMQGECCVSDMVE